MKKDIASPRTNRMLALSAHVVGSTSVREMRLTLLDHTTHGEIRTFTLDLNVKITG